MQGERFPRAHARQALRGEHDFIQRIGLTGCPRLYSRRFRREKEVITPSGVNAVVDQRLAIGPTLTRQINPSNEKG